MIKKFLREPLVHFLAAALLLLLFLDKTDSPKDSNVIRISSAQTKTLQEEWQQRWRRPPNQQELDGLVDSVVREELYYREGLRLGLDIGDAVVRNRMIQKMRYLQDQQIVEPSLADLQEWLLENKEKYQDEISTSFEQVFLGDNLDKSQANKILASLNKGDTSLAQIEKNLLVPRSLVNVSEDEISRIFGANFAAAISTVSSTPSEKEVWSGPIPSGFGWHIVNIAAVNNEAFTLESPAMLKKVKNDWLYAQNQQREQEYVQTLLSRYDLRIEN